MGVQAYRQDSGPVTPGLSTGPVWCCTHETVTPALATSHLSHFLSLSLSYKVRRQSLWTSAPPHKGRLPDLLEGHSYRSNGVVVGAPL